MKTNLLIPGVALIALVIGLGVGLGVNQGQNSAVVPADAAEKQIRTRAASRSSDRGPAEGKDRKRDSIEEIYQRPAQSNRILGLLDYYANLSADQFQGEAEKLESLPFSERILPSVLLFGKWAEVDPAAAMAFTDSVGLAGSFVRPTVLQEWANSNPVGAAKYYTENPAKFETMNMLVGSGGDGGRQSPTEIIAGEWAKLNPEAAMKWASTLKANSNDAMAAVVSEVPKRDPAKAADMIASMDPLAQGDAYASLAKQWGANNFFEAQEWAKGLPADQRGRALAAAIEGLAQTSPSWAVHEIGKLTDAEDRRNAIPLVAKNLAREDPIASMTWLNSINDNGAKRDAMREIMPILSAADSSAALEFVKSQTYPEVRDIAAQSYVWNNLTASPAELIKVAGMISDEGDKTRTTAIVAARWMQEDKEAATAYINGNSLMDDNLKERLLNGESMQDEF